MHTLIQRASLATLFISIFFSFSAIRAQSAGNSGTIYGTVTDPTGAVIPNAAVSIQNPVSGLNRQTKTDGSGRFQFTNLPLNPYHLTVSAATLRHGRRGRGRAVDSSAHHHCLAEARHRLHYGRGHDRRGRPHRERSGWPYRCRPQPLPGVAAGERVLHTQFARHRGISRRRRRLQRPLPWPRRPRIQLLLHRQPAHHRPAEQGLLESASL